jgi:glycosyltransferase involved in cell wall biosynthesis
MANAARTYVGWRGQVRRWVDRVERRRWAAIEAQVADAAAAVVVCSARDVELVEAAKTFVIANPYPPSTITAEERGSGSDDGHTITFIGTLTTPPNQEACALLVNEIMPRVWATVPSARLRLVGTTPAGMAPPDDDRITVTGFVEDPNDELRRATLAVAPFLSGGGTRIKILEAFRAGVPVVATSVGIEGIDATDGVHAVVRDDPRAFADACVRLLGDRAFALRLAGAAAELVATRHSPKAISASLASALEATSCGR